MTYSTRTLPLLIPSTEHFDSPESLLATLTKLVGAHLPPGNFPSDALNTVLRRAEALALVLQFHHESEGRLTDEVLMQVACALEGLLSEAITILEIWSPEAA